MNWMPKAKQGVQRLLSRIGPLPERYARKAALTVACSVFAGLAPSAAAAADGGEPIDTELGKYWNMDQAVPSLSNPLYERKGGFEGSVQLGSIPNDNFYLFYTAGGRVAYYLGDTLALQGGFQYLMADDSKILTFLKCVPASNNNCSVLTKGAQAAPQMHWNSALDVVFTPFHGKWGIFDKKLTSFDVNFSAGLGVINVDIDESKGNLDPVNKIKFGGHWGLGFRFYLSRFLNVQLGYNQYIYQPQKNISFLAPAEFTLGLAYLSK